MQQTLLFVMTTVLVGPFAIAQSVWVDQLDLKCILVSAYSPNGNPPLLPIGQSIKVRVDHKKKTLELSKPFSEDLKTSQLTKPFLMYFNMKNDMAVQLDSAISISGQQPAVMWLKTTPYFQTMHGFHCYKLRTTQGTP